MKNAWFVLCLLASILIHAAIIDSARLEPISSVKVARPAAPVIEARGPAQPALPAALPTRSSAEIGDDATARGELGQPELPAIGSGSTCALRR
jgi:hypothetical protein